MKNICIIGMGNMGKAIFDGLECAKNLFNVEGIDRGDDINEALEGCDVFVLAVKPQDFEALAGEMKASLDGKVVISIMAGVGIDRISEALNVEKVVRVMPNLPLKYKKSLSGWICSEKVNDEEKGVVREILKCLGEEIEVDSEEKIDMITALSGSGPAYFYFLNEALRKKALEFGFTEEEARKIVDTTFKGSAKLLEDGTSEELIKKICSKGGTTEAALKHLEEKQVESMIMDAVERAFKRAGELNDGFA